MLRLHLGLKEETSSGSDPSTQETCILRSTQHGSNQTDKGVIGILSGSHQLAKSYARVLH